jgi:nicotinate-nucleotide pyrophosphorylase (carboxylating)
MGTELDPTEYDEHLLTSLEEDAVDRDVTTEVLNPNQPVQGQVKAREKGVLAGRELFKRIFELLPEVSSRLDLDSPTVRKLVEDGGQVVTDQTVVELTGPARAILAGERVALNYLQQLSGVATTVRKLVDLAEPHGVEVCDTRKTVPHMRRLQKYAVRKGGATNHRMDLSETVLVKDNHKELAGGLENYLDLLTTDRSVIVEIHNMDELVILKDYRGTEDFDIDIVMLDNFESTDVKTVVRDLPDEWTAEVSGGITTDNIQAYCSTGVDRVSVGAITHSFDSLDLSLSITPSRS